MKNTHIRNLKSPVPIIERMEVYQEALEMYEENLERIRNKTSVKFPGGAPSGKPYLILPCLLWDLEHFTNKCPDGKDWDSFNVTVGFPEISAIPKLAGCHLDEIKTIISTLKSILNEYNSQNNDSKNNIMYTVEKSKRKEPKIVKAYDTKIGDLVEIVEPRSSYNGKILLHIYNGFVLLEEPRGNWESDLSFNVRLLEPGESITVTVK